MRRIRFTQYAFQRARERGTNATEVAQAIRTSKWKISGSGRLTCSRVFSFEKEWNKKYYRDKLVLPIFYVTSSEIVVVTVYVYFREAGKV